jgi:hypothetical protein
MSTPTEESREVWSDSLHTFVTRIYYDFPTKRGAIHMPHGCCVDMPGAIDMFTGIDPDVRRIDTFSAGAQDTCYEFHNKTWRVVDGQGLHMVKSPDH